MNFEMYIWYKRKNGKIWGQKPEIQYSCENSHNEVMMLVVLATAWRLFVVIEFGAPRL